MEEGYYLVEIDRNVGCGDFKDYRFYACIGLYRNHIIKYSLNLQEYSESVEYSLFVPMHNSFVEIESYNKEDIVKGLKKIDNIWINTPESCFKFTRTLLEAGEKYYKIYRPLLTTKVEDLRGYNVYEDHVGKITYSDGKILVDHKDYLDRVNQLEILISDLKSVFRTASPTNDNLKVYGNNIRNIIILACTEAEDMMKSILKSNGYTKTDSKSLKNVDNNKKSQDFTTKDYVKLKAPLRLDEYQLSLKRYLSDRKFQPFSGWNEESPSQSLNWYSAYNAIKHDRTESFAQASLENAILSVCAVAVLFIAQYGYRNDIWKESIGSFLTVTEEPFWDIGEFYIPGTSGDNNIMVKYDFQGDK